MGCFFDREVKLGKRGDGICLCNDYVIKQESQENSKKIRKIIKKLPKGEKIDGKCPKKEKLIRNFRNNCFNVF